MRRRVVLFNLRYDQLLTSFVHDAAGGAVTAVAVSTNTLGKPLLVAGGVGGVVTAWDLKQRKLHAIVKVTRNN